MGLFDNVGQQMKNQAQAIQASSQPAPQKTSYQQNLAKPIQQNTNWYKGAMPTTTEMYGRIAYISQYDANAARQIATGFAQAQQTAGSPWYNPYLQATNQAVNVLKSYNINPADLTDEWFQQNTEWQNHLLYGKTTNTPQSPMSRKNATDQQKIAYSIYQYRYSMEQTKKAQEEAKALREEVAYKANDPNHNWSDDQIINGIDWEKKYSTLAKAKSDAAAGKPMEFNDAIAFSDDDMRGWIWAARNNGGTGDVRSDMAMYANNEGTVWEDKPEIAAKWDKKGEGYSPFQAGMTLDPEVGLYFNQYSFNREDIDRLWKTIDENDATAVSMLQKADKSVTDWETANDELAKLNKRITSLVNGSAKRDPQAIKDLVVKELQDGKKYPMLSKMDENINKPWSDIVELGASLDFSRNSLFASIDKQCEERDSKQNGGQFQNSLAQSENGAPVLPEGIDAVSGAAYQAPAGKEPEKTEQPKEQETAPAAAPAETYTPADIATGQEKDKARNDAAASVEDDMTDEEKTVFANTGSSFFDRTREMLTEKVKTVTENLETFNKAITQGASAVCTQKYFETALETSYDIALYKDTQAALDEDEAQLAVYQQKYGDIKYLQEATTFKPEVDEQIGDFNVSLRFDESQDRYVVENIYSTKRDIDYQMLMSYAGQGLDWVEDTLQQADALAEKLTPEAQKARAALANAEKYGEEGQQEIKAYKALYAKAERERQYLADNEQAYKDGDALMTQMTNDLEMMIDAQHMLGLDTTYVEEALAYIDHLSNYYDEPKLPGREDDYLQSYLKLNPTATPEESRKYLDELAAKAQKEIDYIELDEDFLTGSGYKVPDKIKRNLQYRKEDLQNILKSIEYSKVKMDTDPKEFSAAVEAGKAFEKKALDNAHEVNLIGLENNVGSNYYGFEDLATEDEKELYYYYLGKSAMAGEEEYDRLTEQFRNSRNVADREAAKEALDNILKEGADYLDFLGNDDYGVWKVRDAKRIAEKAQADVDAGTGSGVVANIESTLLTPLESIESAIYLLDRAIGGKRINPNTGARGFSIYKENVRAATQQSIKKFYGEGTFAEKLASLGYEIYSNRGDSLMNSMVFGPIFGFSGKFGDILNSFAGSTPMGATAALNAAAHAVEQGASVDQAWLIGGITFLSETLTEAITFSNIKEAFGTTRGLTKDTLKEFFREWVTKNGLEEAMGESLNDILENAGEEWAQAFEKDPNAYLSGRQQLIDKYIGEGYTEDEALERAVSEEINGVLHTAFVSYLSAGSDVAMKTLKAGWNTAVYGAEVANYYRKATKFRQKQGYSESILDNMLQRKKKTMREYFTDEASTATAMDAAISGEQAVDQQMSEGTQQSAEATDARVNLNEQKQNAAMRDVNAENVNEQKKGDLKNKKANEVKKGSAEEQQAAAAVVAIQRAKTADAATQAAAASAFLDEGTGPAPDYQAAAGAAYVSEIFGEDGASMIQQTVMGAAKSKISLSIVKQSIKNALLGNGAATQIAKSEAFRNASPEEKARMITSVFGQDMRDQEVQNSIFAKCKDYRRTQEMTNLMDEGFFEEVQTARENANKAAADEYAANEELNAQRNVEQQAADNLTEMSRIATEDPSHDNMERQHKAIENHKSQAIVTDQREEAARKTADKRKAADEKANEVSKKKMKEAREIADQKIAEQDINLAQQQEQQRIAQEQQAQAQAEEQARLQAEEDERTGKTQEEEDNAKIDTWAKKTGMDEETVKRLKARQEQRRLGKVNMQGRLSDADSFLALGALSRKLGVRIELSDNLGVADGKYENGVIYLNAKKAASGEMRLGHALVQVALHEITHSLENTKHYKQYRDIVIGTLFGFGDSYNAEMYQQAIDKKIELYKMKANKTLTPAEAEQEIVADFAKQRLSDKDVVQRFMDAGMGGRMRNMLHNINQALKNFFSQLKGEDRTMAENLRRAEREFQKAMVEKAKTDVHPTRDALSVPQFVQSLDLQFDEGNLAVYKYVYDEDGNKMKDANGNYLKGEQVTEVTPEMIDGTPVGLLIDKALKGKNKRGEDNKVAAKKMFADLMSLVLKYRDSNLVWEIAGSTLDSPFSALKANSDTQYLDTVDFGTICAKTQAIINVMSKFMNDRAKRNESLPVSERTYGLTRQEVMQLYKMTHEEGLSVPCPVCYVFSRWLGVPSLLGKMAKYQDTFLVMNDDGKTINREETEKNVQKYLKDLPNKEAVDEKEERLIKDLKSLEKERVKIEDQLSDEKKPLTPAARRKAEARLNEVLGKMTKIDEELDSVDSFNWVTQALCKQDENGEYHVDPDFEKTPEDILFDLNKTGEFAKYKKNWTYRTTRGSQMGKAILPYGGEQIGDILGGTTRNMGTLNPWLNKDGKAAQADLDSARLRAVRQNLVGGQRLQSTSDYRPEWGLDYVMAFLELQAMESSAQMYTKVAEAVDFFASVGADVNLSIMGAGSGYHIATDAEIALANSGTKEGNELKSRMGVTKDADGVEHTYVMDFSDVTGMEYGTAKEKSKKFNNVQMILVGMNDIHVRLAMANDDIDFIIPWHSSGNSKSTIQQLVSSVNEELDDSSDFSFTQSDKKLTHKVRGEDGKLKSVDNRSQEQKDAWEARIKILTGKADQMTDAETAAVFGAEGKPRNEYLYSLYQRFYGKNEDGTWIDPKCGGVVMLSAQAKQIFPYEYWDTTSTRENADDNGHRFIDYCWSLGVVPRFSGKQLYKGSGKNRKVVGERSNFAGAIFNEQGDIIGYNPSKMAKGYWKLLIDRKMFDNDTVDENGQVQRGKYREQQKINVTDASVGYLSDQVDEETGKRKVMYRDEKGEEHDAMIANKTSAKYGVNYSAKEQAAVDRANSEIDGFDLKSEPVSGDTSGQSQLDVGGLTDVELDDMLRQAGVDYQDAMDRGDVDASQKDLDTIRRLGGDDAALDTEYMYAVQRGDMEKAQQMVNEQAEVKRAEVFAATDVPTYRVRRGYEPKTTKTVYKTFTLDDQGRPSALFVSSTHPIPVGVWLDAQDTQHFTNVRNGKMYVPSTKNPNTKGNTTGSPIPLTDFSKEDVDTFIKQGFIKPGRNGKLPKTITMLAYRPGWHAGDMPFFPQGGMQIEGSNYKNVHRYNQVVFECEMAADEDYTSFSTTKDGKVKYRDRQEMPVDGIYKYSTNMMANSQDIGAWYISGALKIVRALSQEECDSILAENGYAPQEWQAYQDQSELDQIKGQENKDAYEKRMGPLDLDALGYDPTQTDGGKKLLDPVTYDDNGNVIPISKRFDESKSDPRYSFGDESTPTDAELDDMLRQAGTWDEDIEWRSATDEELEAKVTDEEVEMARQWYKKQGWADSELDQMLSQGGRLSFVEPARYGMKKESDEKQWANKTPTRRSSSPKPETASPVRNASPIGQTFASLEGQNPTMSTAQGPKVRAFADVDGMLRSSDEIDRFAKAVTLAQNTYFPDTNYDQIQRAVNWIRSIKQTPNSDGYAEALQAVTDEDFDYRSADGQARMVAVMGLASAKNDVMAQAALGDAFMRQGTDLGRALQARKLFLLMTPQGRVSTLYRMLENQKRELGKQGKSVDLKFSKWIERAAEVAEDEADFIKVRNAAAAELAEQLPANWKDRLTSIRMLSMLANPRTHIRNIIGNAMFIPAVSLKNKMGALMELGVKKGEKTKTLSPFLKKETKAFAREIANNNRALLTGEAKFSEGTQIKQKQAPLGQFVKLLSDVNSKFLEGEDWIFLKGHFRRAFGGWMQANGYTADQVRNDPALMEKGMAYAVEEAQKATYRDYNEIASNLNKITRNPKTNWGKAGAFIVDAALPFKKTPINILRRGLEYSPLGVAKGVATLFSQMKNGKINPTQVIDQICSGLSGTAVTAMGFLLAGSGAVSCGLDDDEDKIKKAKGEQKYAINLGQTANEALGLLGIPKLFGEDVTFTVDWAAPMSMPFFIGAAIREQMEEEDDFDLDKALNSLLSISEPLFNLSMLDGVNTLFKTSQYEDTNELTQIFMKLGMNYVSSFVPSALGAATRTFFDDTQRKSFVSAGENKGPVGTFRYSVEQMENKIPGVSKTNIPVRDIWGEKKTSDFWERLAENFILPGYISKIEDDPVLDEMSRLFIATGDNSMIPKEDPDKSESYTNKMTGQEVKHAFTAEEWDRLKEVRGQTALKELTELINSEGYKRATNAEQVEMIDAVWKHADKVGKQAVLPDFPLDDTKDVNTIARDSRLTSQKEQMFKALEDEDYDTYETMVEAVKREFDDEDEADDKIRGWLRDKYSKQYKEAYRRGDADGLARMTQIEDFLYFTGYDFDFDAWQLAVDEKYGI